MSGPVKTAHPPAGDPGEHHLSALWQPVAIAGVVVQNRAMMTAMTLQYGSGGSISDRQVAFYRERARGGVGLLLSEQLTASPLNESCFASALLAYDRNHIRGFARVVTALRPHGTRFFAQLFAPGAAGSSMGGIDSWSALRAPSRIAAPGMESPLPLTVGEMQRLAEDFGRSAGNMKEAGVDGVEIHGSHGWLIGQFLSPFYNRRTDEYGGTVENRCRYAVEVAAAVRAAVGPDYPVGISLTYDELMGAAGITPEDTLDQLRVLDASGLFDFFDLSIGSSHQQHHTLASMSVPHGFAIPFGALAKQVVGKHAVIMLAGRIVDPTMAAHAVANGHADMVGMTRALFADPHLLLKARTGKRTSIIRCVGVNACVRRSLADQPAICVLNPVAGRESKWGDLAPSQAPLRIAVVGAGPAGLRFAATAARRGNDVSVFERQNRAGGHLARLAALPTRESWALAVSDMLSTLQDAGAKLFLNHAVSTDDLLLPQWDAVVLATGATWDTRGATSARFDRQEIPGLQSGRVLSPDEAIDTLCVDPTRTLGKRVLIVDGVGDYLPLGVADLIAARGAKVTLVTPHESLGRIASAEQELPHVMPRLLARGVTTYPAHDVEKVEGRTVTMCSVWGGAQRTLKAIDAIVLATSRLANDSLFEHLRQRRRSVYCIGDAISPRLLEAVIFEAEELARRI